MDLQKAWEMSTCPESLGGGENLVGKSGEDGELDKHDKQYPLNATLPSTPPPLPPMSPRHQTLWGTILVCGAQQRRTTVLRIPEESPPTTPRTLAHAVFYVHFTVHAVKLAVLGERGCAARGCIECDFC